MTYHFETTGGPKHADRDQDRHQVWDDSNRDLKSLFGAVDELLINLYPTQRAEEWKRSQKKRDGKLRDGIHDFHKERLAGCFRRDWQAEQTWKCKPNEEVHKQQTKRDE